MKTEPRLLHDIGLFNAVFACVHDKDPSVREGAMFGCPAAFVGAHLAFCVYGSGIGLITAGRSSFVSTIGVGVHVAGNGVGVLVGVAVESGMVVVSLAHSR